jgi:hypothetical protein
MLAIRCIRIAGVYLLIGMVMGIVMGATENFALRPVHAHLNLLGWVGLALAACVFRLWPEVADSRLARAFFWGYNLTLPVLLVALGLFLYGHVGILPVMAVAEFGVFGSVCLFVASLFRHLRVPFDQRVGQVGVALGRAAS